MEKFLSQMIAEINKKRQALEKECELLESLLKPWPKKRSGKANEDHEVKIATNSVSEPDKTCLSQEEKLAVLQVNELLQKAQKTRHLKQKNKSFMKGENGQDNKDDDIYNNKIPEQFSSQASENPMSSSSLRSTKITEVQTDGSKTSVGKRPTSAFKVPTNKNSFTSHTANQSKGPPLSGSTNVGKNKLSVSSSGKTTESEASSSSRQRNYRPSSGARSSRPSSRTGRHVPVHMSAPFKTDENIKFPKRRLNQITGHKPGVKNISKPVPVGVKTYKTLPGIKSADQTDLLDIASDDDNIVPTRESVTPVTASQDQISEIFDAYDNDSACHSNRDKVGHVSPRLKSMHAEDLNTNQNTESDFQSLDEGMSTEVQNHLSGFVQSACSEHDSEQQGFSLKKSGSSLKLPGHMKKLVSVNVSLRNKCAAARLVKRVSSVDPAQQFVDKLDAQAEMGQELWTRFSALTCLKSHQILLETLESLQLDRISENTPYEVIYRAQRILQFALSSFADWQEEADYISRVKFRELVPVRELHKTEKDPFESSWFDGSKTKGPRDDVDLQDNLNRSKHWAHLRFAEQYLRLYLAVMEAARSEWWNVLLSEREDYTVESSLRDPGVLQGVYSLLTTSGQFLPTLVENPDF